MSRDCNTDKRRGGTPIKTEVGNNDKPSRIRIILASASPRRKQILSEMNIPFESRDASIAEDLDATHNPTRLARKLALEKARACLEPDALVIGMDTLVVIRASALGKPSSLAEAARMLRRLSGKTHEVITGVAVLFDSGSVTASETTRVTFRRLSSSEIDWYLSTGEPMDKAGAYAIQGLGRVLIKRIDGCYFNVVGFPINCFHESLRRLGISLYDLMQVGF